MMHDKMMMASPKMMMASPSDEPSCQHTALAKRLAEG